MPFLKIRDLSYTYPATGIRAVDGLNFDAEKGEVIAVIGPNAAGKSSFALLLKGLLVPTSGRVWIDGEERQYRGPDGRIGILFSSPENQLITSIVEEDIAFGLEIKGVPSLTIREKVQKTLKDLGITHLKGRMPHLLSGGEQQMAALAGVLVLDPDILILDEPTTYLDPLSKAAVLASVKQLADQGKLVFLITHDMKEATLADRMIVLNDGGVIASGVPEEVFARQALLSRFGISPPFLLDLLIGLKSTGMSLEWPQEPATLAGILAGAFGMKLSKAQETPRHASDLKKKRAAALSFEEIYFSYEHSERHGGAVLEGVDFEVPDGGMAFLCGANGSGKSTLLQMSNGLVTPDHGKVLLSGHGLKYWKKRPGGVPTRIGFMFQNAERQVFSNTVFDDIAFGPRNLGLTAEIIEERVKRAADWAGLPREILSRPVLTLSGGQMRRTAVAGILALESRVLVLDEPTDGLDPGGTKEFYSNARLYCDETGTSILVAAHAVPEQTGWIEYMGHLAGGRIQSSGSPMEVLIGLKRTLPKQFLPDHLILGIELADVGMPLPDEIFDPAAVRQSLLDLASESGT